jgi:hypothetical protein
MFEDFITENIDAGETIIFLRRAGSGLPLLLLHGFPQTHLTIRLAATGGIEDAGGHSSGLTTGLMPAWKR